MGERGTGSWKLWGKSRIRSSTKSYKKEEHKGKQEQIQQVVRFTDYISVSTKYKKKQFSFAGKSSILPAWVAKQSKGVTAPHPRAPLAMN